MKFRVRKGTTILIAITEQEKRVCMIGRVSELMSHGIVEFAVNPTFKNWLLIDTDGSVIEFRTKEEAKTAARLKYE